MKHPYFVIWIDEDGKQRSSSFASEAKARSLFESLSERELVTAFYEQTALAIRGNSDVSATYDPRYEIPY